VSKYQQPKVPRLFRVSNSKVAKERTSTIASGLELVHAAALKRCSVAVFAFSLRMLIRVDCTRRLVSVAQNYLFDVIHVQQNSRAPLALFCFIYYRECAAGELGQSI
jgi:hypothetical protein